MNAFRFVCVALCVALAAPAFAKDASRTRLLTAPNPAKLGQTVKLVGEVDGFGGGAPTGTANFTDGDVALGAGALSPPYGAGQATLTAGERHTCALTADGGAKCWGSNVYGQLGNGGGLPVSRLAGRAIAIAAGKFHSCALTAAGGVKCWGYNTSGQLGDGTRTLSRVPINVSGLSTGIVAIAAGDHHSCALTSAGAVKCWGYNVAGQLGDGTTTNRDAPVSVHGLSRGVVAISANLNHSCALTAAGAVKCWGRNVDGRLGDGTQTDRHRPVAVSGLSSGVVAIAAGADHSCALTSAHGVKCWGRGRLTPADVATLSSGVVAITAGGSHSCALKGGGALVCWGLNGDGQLGDRTRTDRDAPVSVPGHTRRVAAITAGRAHTCVSMVTGVVHCWGLNNVGQVGSGNFYPPRLAPSPVPDVTAVIRTRASLLTNALGAGTHTLRATYSGDAAHSQSSGSRAQTIAP